MTRYPQIEKLRSSLAPSDRFRFGMLLSKLSDADKSCLNEAIDRMLASAIERQQVEEKQEGAA